MRHLDLLNQDQQAVLTQLSQAMAGDNEQQLAEAMTGFANMIQNQVLQEAQRQNYRAADRSILSSRGRSTPWAETASVVRRLAVASERRARPSETISQSTALTDWSTSARDRGAPDDSWRTVRSISTCFLPSDTW